jgi:SpoVK/Ycf46/Vps4 family AAA+-type ATPase
VEAWGLDRVYRVHGRTVINFYGPPGSGKTATARAVAKIIGKNLYQVDYAAVVSKWVGDTSKHIRSAFRRAAELDAILFWDEADSLFSKRVRMGDGEGTSINQNRNTLMQELDRFPGIVIAATNFFQNYDAAILRRIQRHIHFGLPNESMREKLYALHLPRTERLDNVNLARIAEISTNLSGGDILNVCVMAMEESSLGEDPAQWKLTHDTLVQCVENVKRSKAEHRYKKPSTKTLMDVV